MSVSGRGDGMCGDLLTGGNGGGGYDVCGILLVKEGLLNVVVSCPRLNLPFSIRCSLLSTISNVVITPCSFWKKGSFSKKGNFSPSLWDHWDIGTCKKSHDIPFRQDPLLFKNGHGILFLGILLSLS